MVPALLTPGLMPAVHQAPILIVEDDRNTLSGYVEYLSNAGYEVLGVADGDAALPLAMTHGPGVVVTDITLPGINGFALATALRQDPRTQQIPVIGLTAHWSRDIHRRAAEVPMCAVLRKPCVPSHLLAEVERLLNPSGSLQRL